MDLSLRFSDSVQGLVNQKLSLSSCGLNERRMNLFVIYVGVVVCSDPVVHGAGNSDWPFIVASEIYSPSVSLTSGHFSLNCNEWVIGICKHPHTLW